MACCTDTRTEKPKLSGCTVETTIETCRLGTLQLNPGWPLSHHTGVIGAAPESAPPAASNTVTRRSVGLGACQARKRGRVSTCRSGSVCSPEEVCLRADGGRESQQNPYCKTGKREIDRSRKPRKNWLRASPVPFSSGDSEPSGLRECRRWHLSSLRAQLRGRFRKCACCRHKRACVVLSLDAKVHVARSSPQGANEQKQARSRVHGGVKKSRSLAEKYNVPILYAAFTIAGTLLVSFSLRRALTECFLCGNVIGVA